MKLQIFHTVNAGLYIWNGRSGLLIDGLHGGKAAGFSDTPERYLRMMERRESFFGQVNDLLFTHTHSDHYDPELTDLFLQLNAGSFVYGPGLDRSNLKPLVLNEGIDLIQMRDYRVYAFSTVHDGEMYAGQRHCSYLIQSGGHSLWISGDAVLEPPLADKVKEIIGEQRIEAAFVIIYQIGNRQGKEFLRRLGPDKIYLYHLPYREDDRFGYYRMAEGLIKRCGRENISITALHSDSFL